MKYIATIAVVVLAFTAINTKANENPIIDSVEKVKQVAVNNKVTEFVVTEYNDMKEFQSNSWQQGKDQLNHNKEQIVGFFTNVKDAFDYYFIKETQ